MDITKYNTPELHLVLICNMLMIVTQVLEKHNIEYFIDGGTLLASVREGNIIQHDDDADIGVLSKDFNNLHNILGLITKYGIEVDDKKYQLCVQIESQNMVKVFIPNLWAQTESGRIIATPTIDIFRYALKNDRIQLESPKMRKMFKNCYYLKDEMYPLVKHKFGTLELYGANKPLGYLYRYYGDDCLQKGKVDLRDPKDRNLLNKSDQKIEYEISFSESTH